jgi:hypothetical protein
VFANLTTLVVAHCRVLEVLAAMERIDEKGSHSTQLLRSLYGVEQHTIHPHELQPASDSFWLDRVYAARVLRARLAEVEEAFADACATS